MRNIKLLTALFLSASLVFSLPFSAYAEETALTKAGENTYTLFDGGTISGVVNRGVDVSHWQGTVDWKTAAANDVDFVMLGTRYKGEVDPNFSQNAKGAAAAGIKLGAYIYSYATTPEMAAQEADFVINLIKDYPISYPIAYDVEDESTQGTLSKTELTAIIKAFCERIRSAGYYPIIYANDYWLLNKLDTSSLSAYPVWVAAYQRMHNWKNPVMWQATSTGTIPGFSGNVDIDLQFSSFTDKIKTNTWRQISGSWYYYQDSSLQKNALINDGSHVYFLNSDGTINKDGWKTISGSRYYLDPNSGAAKTGWAKDNGSWIYFAEDGKQVSSAWLQSGSDWYYLSQSGNMATGWISDNGTSYFLGDSGTMKTGWQQLGSDWYYFGNSGALHKGIVELNGVKYNLGSDGKMLHDTTADINGITYSIDGSGAMREAAETAGGKTAAETSAAAESTAAVSSTPAVPNTQNGTVTANGTESAPANETAAAPVTGTVSPSKNGTVPATTVSGENPTASSTSAQLVSPSGN